MPAPAANHPFRAGRVSLVLGLLVALVLAGCDEAASSDDPGEGTSTSPSTAAEDQGTFHGAITAVVEEARPSVVHITSQHPVGIRGTEALVPAGVGSGVVIDEAGHILTNNHVIQGAAGLMVRLEDGSELQAEVVGQDAQTDLAVLRVTQGDLAVADIGRSGDLEVGAWVVAIGNALGLPGGPTVTSGVVSALGRTIQEPRQPDGSPGPFLFDLVQTDAPINPGNSGGPLLNLDGEVVGINTLVAGGNEVPAQGIGFAIAIDTAMPLAQEMIETGRVSHPYLGIAYVPLNALVAAELGAPRQTGALVQDVAPGSPAADAGLQPGDVIVSFEGDPVAGESDLPSALNAADVGDEVTMEVVRGGETVEVTTVLREQPADG